MARRTVSGGTVCVMVQVERGLHAVMRFGQVRFVADRSTEHHGFLGELRKLAFRVGCRPQLSPKPSRRAI